MATQKAKTQEQRRARRKAKEPKPKSLALSIEHRRTHVLATMLGYNELAKLGKTLGEKVYYRLARDVQLEQFVELGGNGNVFAREDTGVCTIEVPGGPPHIIFRNHDIAMMREAVRRHDEALVSETAKDGGDRG